MKKMKMLLMKIQHIEQLFLKLLYFKLSNYILTFYFIFNNIYFL